MTARQRDERGSIAASVVISATMFLFVMAIIQVALVLHARNVAEGAAQEGVTTAAAFDGTEGSGHASATQALNTLGPATLTNRTVDVERTPTTVTVTVTGTALSFIPGISPKIVETSTGPVERYVPPEVDTP
ncbi:TadE family protein [Aeromicrobium alkaliterrae]|uniref:TadE-like domain-containing protein n=1 Tax=Aeromicrobium alkaliterrae TaxID=302168 RepID=A0ABN2KEJ1_9ACTN